MWYKASSIWKVSASLVRETKEPLSRVNDAFCSLQKSSFSGYLVSRVKRRDPEVVIARVVRWGLRPSMVAKCCKVHAGLYSFIFRINLFDTFVSIHGFIFIQEQNSFSKFGATTSVHYVTRYFSRQCTVEQDGEVSESNETWKR